jgi:hypothetical protein
VGGQGGLSEKFNEINGGQGGHGWTGWFVNLRRKKSAEQDLLRNIISRLIWLFSFSAGSLKTALTTLTTIDFVRFFQEPYPDHLLFYSDHPDQKYKRRE